MRCRRLTFSLERPSRVWGINSPKVSMYQTPSQYETKFHRVIDNSISSPQNFGAAAKDRALQGCNSSADAALQTAGVAASKRHTWAPVDPAGASPKRKIPGDSGDRVTRFLQRYTKENPALRVRFSGGTTPFRSMAPCTRKPERFLLKPAHATRVLSLSIFLPR